MVPSSLPALFYVFMVIGWLSLALVLAIVTSLVGWLIRKLTAGRKHENLWRIVLALAGMVGLAANPCAVSISMECRHLWVLKSMPIEERTIFSGKLISQKELLVLR